MTHEYELDLTRVHPAEVCVLAGHGLHTRGDELEASRYPHLFTLDIEPMTLQVRPAGQLAWT